LWLRSIDFGGEKRRLVDKHIDAGQIASDLMSQHPIQSKTIQYGGTAPDLLEQHPISSGQLTELNRQGDKRRPVGQLRHRLASGQWERWRARWSNDAPDEAGGLEFGARTAGQNRHGFETNFQTNCRYFQFWLVRLCFDLVQDIKPETSFSRLNLSVTI
jgi:hypothetical protein